MVVDINELLALPAKERKEIARTLWNSLSTSGSLSDKEIEALNILEKKWEKVKEDMNKLNQAWKFSHGD